MNTITHPLNPGSTQRKPLSGIVIALLAIALVGSITLFTGRVKDVTARADELQNQLTQSKADGEQVRIQLDQAKTASDLYRKQLEQARDEAKLLQSQVTEYKADSVRLQRELDEAKAGSARIQTQLDEAMSHIQTQTEQNLATTADLQKQLQQAKSEANARKLEYTDATVRLTELQAKLDAAQKQLGELQNPKAKTRR
jgi:chromosome segregation ATPase